MPSTSSTGRVTVTRSVVAMPASGRIVYRLNPTITPSPLLPKPPTPKPHHAPRPPTDRERDLAEAVVPIGSVFRTITDFENALLQALWPQLRPPLPVGGRA